MNRRTIHREHWDQLLIEIIDDGDQRSLFFGGGVLQSTMSLSCPNRLVLSYTQCMMASLLVDDEPEDILLIGVGAGSLARFLHGSLPRCCIDAVDNASHVIKLAHGYFALPVDDRLHIHEADGYDFLTELDASRGYDLILIDAFDGNGMAPTVYSRACFERCRSHLRPEGVFSVNLWSGDVAKMDELQTEITARFGAPLVLPVPHRGNVVCLAGRQADLQRALMQQRRELDRLSHRFDLDFHNIAAICRKHNLSRWQRMLRLLS
jgi:spermidine synthase